MVGSGCVVHKCNNHSNRGAGILFYASLDGQQERCVTCGSVQNQEETLSLPSDKICYLLGSLRVCDPRQGRQFYPGSLLTILKIMNL